MTFVFDSARSTLRHCKALLDEAQLTKDIEEQALLAINAANELIELTVRQQVEIVRLNDVIDGLGGPP